MLHHGINGLSDQEIFITAAGRRRWIEQLTTMGHSHLAPIVEVMATGAALIPMLPGKLRFPDPPSRPFLLVVGDDLAPEAVGPSGFHMRSLRKLLEKVRAVYIMSGAAAPNAYQAAADVVESGLSCAIVETQPSEEASWSRFVCRHAPKAAAKTLVTPNAADWDRRRYAGEE